MIRKHIDISAQHKLKTGEFVQWVKTIPAHNFNFITANGVNFAITERNYYLDQIREIIRSKFMDCSNASYNHMYALYAEVYPGIFAYAGVTSENELTEKLERQSVNVNALQPETIETFRQSLVRYGK